MSPHVRLTPSYVRLPSRGDPSQREANRAQSRRRRSSSTNRESPPVCSPAVDAGDPISYEVLQEGTPVYSSDGRQIGAVTHVLAAPEEDVFDGIVIAVDDSSQPHHGGHEHRLRPEHRADHRFVDADEVDAIHERAVTLKLDSIQSRDLPRPTANPAVMREDPSNTAGPVSSKLRRAWDLISGNY